MKQGSAVSVEGPARAEVTKAILALWHREGKWADVVLEGASMDPIIRDGSVLRVRFGRVTTRDLKVGDVIIYSAPARLIAHRVIRVGRRGNQAGLIRVKGDPLTTYKATWIRAEEVLGRVTAVTQPDGSRRYLNTPAGRLLSRSAAWTSRTVGAIEARLPRRHPVHPSRSLTGRSLRALATAHDRVHASMERDRGRLLAREERLLVEACRPHLNDDEVDRIRRCAAELVDWEPVREQAVSLGLVPLLYRNLSDPRLRGLCPGPFLADLGRAAHLSAYGSIRRRQELLRVLDALAGKGIVPVLLKGAALSAVVYDDPMMRTMLDLDLLVREAEIPIAVELLEGLSYRPIYRPMHADPRIRAALYARHHHTTPLMAPRGQAIVELHRHIMMADGRPRYDIEAIRARAREAEVEGRVVRIPAPADLVLHTCLHLSYADRFVGKLRDLIDIHETITTLGREIDWNAMVAEVPSDAAARCLYACLDLARRLYGTAVPADVLYELRRSSGLGYLGVRLLRGLACSVLLGTAGPRVVLPPATAKWCCDTLVKRSGWAGRIGALATLLAQGPAAPAVRG